MVMSKIIMNSKVITSVSALVIATVFASPVAAQTMIGGVEVSASDLPKVQEQCDMLASGSATSLSTDSTNDPAASANGSASGSASGGATGSAGASGGGDAGSASGSASGSAGATGSASAGNSNGESGRTTETGTLSGGATAINLASITVEDCVAAGLSAAGATPEANTTTN